MNHARDEATRGSEELRRAFDLISRDEPCLLRNRYPDEMSKIGTVPIPRIEGGYFGGALIADSFWIGRRNKRPTRPTRDQLQS